LWKIELSYISAFSEAEEHAALIQEMTRQAYEAESVLLQNASFLGRMELKDRPECL
jgi:hypothetical protein